jgi:hypothetical protein
MCAHVCVCMNGDACLCKPGYGRIGTQCTLCPVDTYKSTLSDSACIPVCLRIMTIIDGSDDDDDGGDGDNDNDNDNDGCDDNGDDDHNIIMMMMIMVMMIMMMMMMMIMMLSVVVLILLHRMIVQAGLTHINLLLVMLFVTIIVIMATQSHTQLRT